MLRSSKTIILSTLLYMFALAGYNISGMYITDELGAVTRTVLEALRTLFVWVLDLLLFYGPVMAGVLLGEPWTRFSWMQLGGFVLLVVSSVVYGEGEEQLAEQHAREAGQKADGEVIVVHRHHLLRPVHTLHAAAHPVKIVKGVGHRAWQVAHVLDERVRALAGLEAESVRV
eukprot:jgi/Chrzof1/276/Cz01g09190.t1